MRVLPGRPTGRQTALPALYGRESRIGVRPDPNGDSRSTGSLQKWLCINRSFRFWKIRGVWSVFAVFAHGARLDVFHVVLLPCFPLRIYALMEATGGRVGRPGSVWPKTVGKHGSQWPLLGTSECPSPSHISPFFGIVLKQDLW